MKNPELTSNVIQYLNRLPANHVWVAEERDDPDDDSPMDVIVCARCKEVEPIWTSDGFQKTVRIIETCHPSCDETVVKKVQNS